MASDYQMFVDNFWKDNGFDELRKLMKQGSDFIKEVMSVLHERAEIEKKYSSNLSQLSRKAKRGSSLCIGSVAEAWEKFVESLENEAEMHKNHAQELQQQCHAPLKQFLENKIRQRKPLEQAVERNKKAYQDKFSDQLKCKKNAYSKCRELEQTLEQMEVLKKRGGGSDKEVAKLEKSSKKNDESLLKAERDYKESNVKTEESRLCWESSMYRCCRYLENLEHSRLEQLSEVLKNYSQLLLVNVSPLEETSQMLTSMADQISGDKDIELMCQNNGTGPNNPEQLLLDTYEEDMKNSMDNERRGTSLDKKIQELEGEIDRKEREKKGVESLSAAYDKNPDFVDEQGAADVSRQIIEANSMLNLLKANHFKLLRARCEIDSLPQPESPYSEYIKNRHDKQGLPLTVLSIPMDDVSQLEEQTSSLPAWTPPKTNGGASGGGFNTDNEPPSYKDTNPPDEFEDYNDQPGDEQQDYTYISRCNVVYDYDSQQTDELTIVPGDTIYVTSKIDDDWWQGNLNGVIGLFPASYVDEVEVYES